MILKDFTIDQTHPRQVTVWGKVLIKRDGEWYQVVLKRIGIYLLKKQQGPGLGVKQKNKVILDTMSMFLQEAKKIEEFHIPTTEENKIESTYGNYIFDKVFKF